jgi:hypothetical protein
LGAAAGGGEVKERPILFSGPMVRAILDGTKTVTRRIVDSVVNRAYVSSSCPFGKTGDHLWVRETWCQPVVLGDCKNPSLASKLGSVEYAVDMGIMRFTFGGNFRPLLSDMRWRPSIHMPRWASRITLEIQSIRIERLQDISEVDSIAEGIHRFTKDGELCKYWHCDPFDGPEQRSWVDLPRTANEAFRHLWDSINLKRANAQHSWDKNPFVWVLSFRKI